MNPSRTHDPALPRHGDVVSGKYRIESVLGTGGMGVVMGALDLSLGRQVAIKFLSPNKAVRPDTVERFKREARAAAALETEHVAAVYDVGELPSGAPFIVMEHLRGMDLEQLLTSRGGLPVEEAVDYVLQACEALGLAHARGIIHRDLKPQNLFLTHKADGSPCVKLLDFGISKAHDDENPQLTATDVVMGTPLYMSPEQVRSLKNVDHRADVWALGSILFELLTNSPVFMAPSASALCAMIAMDPPTPLRVRRPQAPEGLELVILRCLHKDPAGRFPDVASLADALVPFASERGRASALRISRTLRSGAPPAFAASNPPEAAPAPFGTTIDGSFRGPSFLPPPAPVPGPSAYPPAMRPPDTHTTWHQTSGSGAAAPPKKSGGRLVFVFAGIATGSVLLAALGAVGYVYFWRTPVPPVASATPSATTSAAPAPSAAPVPAANATVTNAKPGAPAPPPPKTAPAGAKDAGAPAAPPATKDAGVPATPVEPKDDLEARKRITETQCNHHTMQMRQFDKDGKHTPHKQAQLMMCLRASGPQGKTCERAVCREACITLGDKGCLARLEQGERAYKPEY